LKGGEKMPVSVEGLKITIPKPRTSAAGGEVPTILSKTNILPGLDSKVLSGETGGSKVTLKPIDVVSFGTADIKNSNGFKSNTNAPCSATCVTHATCNPPCRG
jgi:hypothetical protein